MSPNLVEYAIQVIFKKRCSPQKASTETWHRLNGYENIFLAPAGQIVQFHPLDLEGEIWRRFVEMYEKNLKHNRPGNERGVALGTLQHFYGLKVPPKVLKDFIKILVLP